MSQHKIMTMKNLLRMLLDEHTQEGRTDADVQEQNHDNDYTKGEYASNEYETNNYSGSNYGNYDPSR